MDPIGTIASVIKDNGIYSIILAVIVWFIWRLLDIILKRIQTRSTMTDKNKGIAVRERANSIIQNLLTDAMSTLKGLRIQIIEFSNGEKNIASVPFQYMSCTYESYALGLQPAAHVCQKVMTSLYAVFLTKLSNSTHSAMILDIDAPLPDFPSNNYDLMRSRHATKSMYVLLRTPVTRKPIGYIVFDANEGIELMSAMDTLKKMGNQVETLLTMGDL
jgi:hypothetical protein